jgi:TPR repeat protein
LVLQSAAEIDLSKTNRATGGLMYLRGQGIPADIVEARKWFVLAAAGAIRTEPTTSANWLR